MICQLLLAGIIRIAGNDIPGWFLVSFVSVPFMFIFLLCEAFFTGSVLSKGGPVSRSDDSVWFHITCFMYSIVVVVSFGAFLLLALNPG